MINDNGLIEIESAHSFANTVQKIKDVLKQNNITLMAEIDHSGEAAKVDLDMPSTRLFIFGNPKAGTPVMLARPSVAIDLPLKILVREDANKKVWLSYNDVEYLKARHNLSDDLAIKIGAAKALAEKIAAS